MCVQTVGNQFNVETYNQQISNLSTVRMNLCIITATVTMAEEHADFVMGFICQNRISENPGFVHMTPGKLIQTKLGFFRR